MIETTEPLHIVIVEDYSALREQLVIHLTNEGHDVQGVDSGIALDELLEHQSPPDILLLDLNLPVEDGHSIAARMRQAFPNIGIIMHTVRTSTSEKTTGYHCGADMYVCKPACTGEISAAIASLARRLIRQPSQNQTWALNVQQQILISPSFETLSLSYSDVLTLKNMALAPNRLLEYERILDLLKILHPDWNKTHLEVYFSRLRKRLSMLLKEQPSIKMVRGIGYVLCFPLEVKA